MDASEAKVHADIATYGWHVVMVAEDAEGPGFAFTIGLYRTFQHPELIVFGLPSAHAHRLLNNAGKCVQSGTRFTAGALADELLPRYACTFRPMPRSQYREFLGFARWYYDGDDFPALQLVWPDREGRFPWDAPPEAWIRRGQPVLADQ